MNYYKRHLGDYARDTTHLSMTQHGAFTLLLDYYYATEKPIPDDRAERVAKAFKKFEREAVRYVLEQFFVRTELGWINARADHVISEAAGKSAKARESALTKWGQSTKAKRAERISASREIATHTQVEWVALRIACGNACVRCGATDSVVKDHILPVYQGGSDGIENLQPLCNRCNASKGPESQDFRPLDWRERMRTHSETPASHKPLATSHKETESKALRASRLPKDWKPSETVMLWAIAEHGPRMAIERELENFRDYWHAAAGARASKLDWDATFRVWMRNKGSKTNGQHRASATDRVTANIMRARAEREAAGETN